MASSLVQFRADSAEKLAAMQICQQLGLDLPTYLRMCLSRLVREKGIPFSMKIEDTKSLSAISAMQRAGRIAQEHGVSDMSLDEINAEIAAVRNGR